MSDTRETVRYADPLQWELAAESITVRIRWFGLCLGYVLVNFVDPQPERPYLNSILTLGAVYALLDTWWSVCGKVFLKEWPLLISGMEAVFISLLCYFDNGLHSPFRFYYFLSLLVCAMRHSPWITYSTLSLHAIGFTALVATYSSLTPDDLTSFVLTQVLLVWVTWASTELANLVKTAIGRFADLNTELQQNQATLEERIEKRTRELQESQAMIVQQEKQAAFGLLAAGIAHEVGNPLAAISSLVQLLNRREIDDETREKLMLVDDQLRRIQRTLRELVDFSRPANLQKQQCDVNEMINAALNIAKYYKRRKGKQIETHYAENLPQLWAVRDQLIQVFLNLILNAFEATEEGTTFSITSALTDEQEIRVEFQDEGHGIAPENLDRVFRPYFTTKRTGTGLGLFVCRNVVSESAGGRLELTETSPTGTCFTIFLPVHTEGGSTEQDDSRSATEDISPTASITSTSP